MENVNVNVNERVSLNKEREQSFAKVVNERLGETRINNQGEVMFIIEYVNALDITVQFKTTGEVVKTTYNHFVRGEIKSHFTPTVYGVGVKGIEPTVDENGKMIDSYKCWCHMLERCYSSKYQKKYPTYKGCYVCNDWLYYPNFKNWYDNNYYEINNKTSQMDKDILIKGNKVYSPNTCIFVPNFINTLFTKSQNTRGEFPIGVSYHKDSKKYKARLRMYKNGKSTLKHLGYYNTPNEAFEVYKQSKEDYIKEVADEYKDIIPVELYKAMCEYEVDIND